MHAACCRAGACLSQTQTMPALVSFVPSSKSQVDDCRQQEQEARRQVVALQGRLSSLAKRRLDLLGWIAAAEVIACAAC